MRRLPAILVVLAWLSCPVQAQRAQQAPVSREISVDHQLLLRRKLMLGSESLLATMRRNVELWEQATPEQRQLLRDRALAFRDASPQQQRDILDNFQKFLQLSGQEQAQYRRRAEWLQQVMDNISSEKREELLKMSPADRAAELLRLKVKLQAEGKIQPDEPAAATQPHP